MSDFYDISIKQERGLAVGIYSGDKRLSQFTSWEGAGKFVDRLFKAQQQISKVYEVWHSAWSAQGNLNNPAMKEGEVEANSFKEACDKLLLGKDSSYNPDLLTTYPGLLYDNEEEANK